MSQVTPKTISQINESDKDEMLEKILFKEFTAILMKHDIPLRSAEFLTMGFGSRWRSLQGDALHPVKLTLHKMPPSIFFAKEKEITEICLRANEEILLLTERDADASV